MNSSQKRNNDLILSVYRDARTVFRLTDIAMLLDESNFQSLNKKLNYQVRNGKLLNPRKGIYTKPDFNPEELACKIYTPSYISLEYVLQKSGITFQYDQSITSVSYLSRSVRVGERTFRFRKIKGEILMNPEGISQMEPQVNMASAERAWLDMMYLNPSFYSDNLNSLNKKLITRLLPIYQSVSLSKRVKKLLENA